MRDAQRLTLAVEKSNEILEAVARRLGQVAVQVKNQDARLAIVEELTDKEPSFLDDKLKSRVIVYAADDLVLDGLLIEKADAGVVLIDVRVQSDDGVALGGHIFVPADKIRFLAFV